MSTLTRTTAVRPGAAKQSPALPPALDVIDGFQRPRDEVAPLPAPISRPIDDGDERLVADPRAGMTPAQMVERKLLSLLDGRALPVSHVQMVVLPRVRGGK